MHWFVALSLASFTAVANEPLRPQRPSELLNYSEDVGVRLRLCRGHVAHINEPALKRDFPRLASMTRDELKDWLIENAAFITRRQLRLQGIRNTAIPVDESQEKLLYRPATGGRSAHLEVFHGGVAIGMIDVKGNGIASEGKVKKQVKAFAEAVGDEALQRQIRDSSYSDGLATGGELAAEMTRLAAMQALFEVYNAEHGTHFETVETYGIIDAGFDIIKGDGSQQPAALYLRQANIGRGNGLHVPPGLYRDAMGKRQRTVSGAAVDGGAVEIIAEGFDEGFRRNFALSADAVELTPESLANEKIYGLDPQRFNPWQWGHRVAVAFRAGDHDAYERHLREMMQPLYQSRRWRERAARAGGESADVALLRRFLSVYLDPAHTEEQLAPVLAALEGITGMSDFFSPFLSSRDELENPPQERSVKLFLDLVIAKAPLRDVVTMLRSSPYISRSAVQSIVLSPNGSTRLTKEEEQERHRVLSETLLELVHGENTSLGYAAFEYLMNISVYWLGEYMLLGSPLRDRIQVNNGNVVSVLLKAYESWRGIGKSAQSRFAASILSEHLIFTKREAFRALLRPGHMETLRRIYSDRDRPRDELDTARHLLERFAEDCADYMR